MIDTNALLTAELAQGRAAAGLSLRELAQAARDAGHRLDASAVCRLEAGRVRWNAGHIDAVAAALGIEPAAFLRRAGAER